jgi:hypothetical protein
MKIIEITLTLIVPITLTLIATKWQLSLWAFIGGLFAILSAWVAYGYSEAPNDIYYIYFIVASLLTVIAFILGAYIAIEDRKLKRGISVEDGESLMRYNRKKPLIRGKKRFSPNTWDK